MGKKEKGSKLLKALGKTKKEQMDKLYPKVKGQIRGKGPYVRGTIGKKGSDTFKLALYTASPYNTASTVYVTATTRS